MPKDLLYKEIVKSYICSDMILERDGNRIKLWQEDKLGGFEYDLPFGEKDFNRWLREKFQIKR